MKQIRTALAAFAFLSATALGAQAQQQIDWSTTAQSLAGDPPSQFELVCPALGKDVFHSVWGTDVYTDDSSICTAAVHAGVITTEGGAVTVAIAPGQASYEASERNGVTASSWGEWGRSFRFVTGGKG